MTRKVSKEMENEKETRLQKHIEIIARKLSQEMGDERGTILLQKHREAMVRTLPPETENKRETTK
jgi:hypothetical protein